MPRGALSFCSMIPETACSVRLSLTATCTGNSGTDSSTPSNNGDGRDHVVTYQISGAHPDPQYVQFWEDLPKTPEMIAKDRTISDFNDLVVQLQPNAIPLPPALLSGSGLIAFIATAGAYRSRFRRH